MSTILLVDDEVMVRMGIKVLIQRSDLSDIEILECDNGKKALEILEYQKVDIAIVDINMPFMDGITLIEESQTLENKPKFIILSGYDDFKYAKSAMKFGVKHYLLKPVDRYELIEALKTVQSELLVLGDMAKDKAMVNNLLGEVFYDEINYILLSRKLDSDKIYKALDRIKIDIFYHEFSFMVVYIDKSNTLSSNESINQLELILKAYLTEQNKKHICFLDEKGNYIIALEGQIDSPMLNKFLSEKNLEQFIIGISMQGQGISDIHQIYDQAYEALKYRILQGDHCLIDYKDIQGLSNDFKVPVDVITKITEMIGLNKLDEISKILSTIFSYELMYTQSINYVEKTVDYIKEIILNKFNNITPDDFQQNCSIDLNKLESVYNFNSLNEYLVELKNYLIHINNQVSEINKRYTEKSAMHDAIQWINENYHREDLSMVLVSNHISLNYSYFSLAFKEFTGMNFVSYLRKLRIEKAKELLKNGDSKVNIVAQKVGYQNPRQFSKSFKEEVGISPIDYINKFMYIDSL